MTNLRLMVKYRKKHEGVKKQWNKKYGKKNNAVYSSIYTSICNFFYTFTVAFLNLESNHLFFFEIMA